MWPEYWINICPTLFLKTRLVDNSDRINRSSLLLGEGGYETADWVITWNSWRHFSFSCLHHTIYFMIPMLSKSAPLSKNNVFVLFILVLMKLLSEGLELLFLLFLTAPKAIRNNSLYLPVKGAGLLFSFGNSWVENKHNLFHAMLRPWCKSCWLQWQFHVICLARGCQGDCLMHSLEIPLLYNLIANIG